MNYEITDILMKKIVSLLCKCDIKKVSAALPRKLFFAPQSQNRSYGLVTSCGKDDIGNIVLI